METKKFKGGFGASDIVCGLYLLREDELRRHGLTRREVVVAQHMLNGESTQHIAKKLRLSVSGVKYHVRKILAKTKTKNRPELCALVRRGVEGSKRKWRRAVDIQKDAEGRITPPKQDRA